MDRNRYPKGKDIMKNRKNAKGTVLAAGGGGGRSEKWTQITLKDKGATKNGPAALYPGALPLDDGQKADGKARMSRRNLLLNLRSCG